VRFDLAAAIEALLEELVKFLLELQECGLLPAFLGLFLFVHGVPSVFPYELGACLQNYRCA
jgi:hypothetical protein